MKHYVLDANAVVRYVRGIKGADKVEAIARQCEQGLVSLSMSVVNLGEAHYVISRYLGEKIADKTVHSLQSFVLFVPVDLEQANEAARIKERFKIGYADSFAAILAIRGNRILVSADPVFEKFGRSLKLLKLPRHET